MTDLSTGKSVLVLATVIGCFAILWPRIFYPMMQATYSLASPIGSPDEPDGERPKPSRARGHPPTGHPTQGPNRIPARMREIIGDGRPDIDPLTTITLEDGRPFTRPGVRGPSNRPQQKVGGTMSIVMPVYTIGIVGFFLYTILKLVFKNKNENEEDPEIDQKGYSSTMKKLGVDPVKLSKLRECVYNSGQSCRDIDEYSELLAASRQQQQQQQQQQQPQHNKRTESRAKPKTTRSDLTGKNNNHEAKPTKKNPFQGLKKQEDQEEPLGSEEEEVYRNLWEAEERVKELLLRVEKRKLELEVKNNYKHHQSKYKQMRDVQEELEQKLQTITPVTRAQEDDNPAIKTLKSDLEREPRHQTELDTAVYDEEKSFSTKPRLEDVGSDEEGDSSNQDEDDDGQSDDEWEDNSDEEVDSDLVPETGETGPEASNDDDKILQILDLLIRDKVQNGGGGAGSDTTKTILRLRKQLNEKRSDAHHSAKRLDPKKNR